MASIRIWNLIPHSESHRKLSQSDVTFLDTMPIATRKSIRFQAPAILVLPSSCHPTPSQSSNWLHYTGDPLPGKGRSQAKEGLSHPYIFLWGLKVHREANVNAPINSLEEPDPSLWESSKYLAQMKLNYEGE